MIDKDKDDVKLRSAKAIRIKLRYKELTKEERLKQLESNLDFYVD